MKIAIVTTLRASRQVLNYFINYHTAIGFSHFYLFFDRPQDELINEYQQLSNITAFASDAYLANLWKRTKSYQENYRFINTEVMARQILNAEVAAKFAYDKGYDWLLHIDVDELFYFSNGNINEHFKNLTDSGVTIAKYLNHEAIPEKMHIENYFSEVTLFKRNYYTLFENQKVYLKNTIQKKYGYFNFYDNGKAAVLLTKNTKPEGVHSFSNVLDNVKELSLPFILHYPCCGFNNFFTKYKTLGHFADKWFNRGDPIEEIAPVHIESRNILELNDLEQAKRYYWDAFNRRFCSLEENLFALDILFRVNVNLFNKF